MEAMRAAIEACQLESLGARILRAQERTPEPSA
jgi:hypothetical protein